MKRILEAITRFEAGQREISQLQELTDLLKSTSLCGLGQSAPNPVISTMRYFADEYKAHVDGHRCPAGICHSGDEKDEG
jgi:NADH:ubiquinone oxidoreductase subunit F (NADH-binding)